MSDPDDHHTFPSPPPPQLREVQYIVSDSQVLGALYINALLGGLYLFGFVVLRGWVNGPGGIFQRRQELQDLFMRPPRLVLGTVRQIWNWLAPLLAVSDADIVRCAGFDALVLTRVLLLGLQMFTVMTILGVGVLIPAYHSQSNLKEVQASSGSLATITMANISPGSKMFLLPFFFTYIFTGYCCVVLWVNNKCYTQLRLAYFQCMDVLPPEAALEAADKTGEHTPAGARTLGGPPSAAVGAAGASPRLVPAAGSQAARPAVAGEGTASGPHVALAPGSGPLGEGTEMPQHSTGGPAGAETGAGDVQLTEPDRAVGLPSVVVASEPGPEAATAAGPHTLAGEAALAEGQEAVEVPEMEQRSMWFNAANFVAPPLRMMLDHLDWMGPLQRAAAVFGLRNLRLPMIHDDQAPPNARLYGKDEDMLGWDQQSLALVRETPEGGFTAAGAGAEAEALGLPARKAAAAGDFGPKQEPRGGPGQLPAVLPYWRPAAVLSSLKPQQEDKQREAEASLPMRPVAASAAVAELRRRPTALRAAASAAAAAAAVPAGAKAEGGGGTRNGSATAGAGGAAGSAAQTPRAYTYLRHVNGIAVPLDELNTLQASVSAAARAAAAPIRTDRELLSDTSQPLFAGKVNARLRQLLRVPLPPPPEDAVPTSTYPRPDVFATPTAASAAGGGQGQAFDTARPPAKECTRLVNARHFVVLIKQVQLQHGPSLINRMAALAYVIVSSLRSGMTFAAAKAAAAAANVGSAMHRHNPLAFHAPMEVEEQAREDAEREGAAEAEVRAARATTVKGKNKAIQEVLRYYSMFRFGQSERDFLQAASTRTAAPAAARGLTVLGGSSTYTPAGSAYGTPAAGSTYTNSRTRVASSASPQLPSRPSPSPGAGPVAEATEAPGSEPRASAGAAQAAIAPPGSVQVASGGNARNSAEGPRKAGGDGGSSTSSSDGGGGGGGGHRPHFPLHIHKGPTVQAVEEAQAAMEAADARAEAEEADTEDPNGAAVAHVLRMLYPHSFLGLVPIVDHEPVDALIYAWDAKMMDLAAAVRELRLAQAKCLDQGDVESGGETGAGVAAGGRPGPCGDKLPGFRSVEAIRESISELRDQVTELEAKIEAARAEALTKPIGTAYFAMFNDALDAQMLAQCPRVIPPRGPGSLVSFEASPAPAPEDVHWAALWSTDELTQFWRRIAIVLPMAIIFLIPIGPIQGALANLNVALCAGQPPGQQSPPLAPANALGLTFQSPPPPPASNDIYVSWFCNPDTFGEKLANSLLTGVLPSVLGLVWGSVIMPKWFHMCCSISRKSTSLSAMEREMQTWWFWYSLFNTFLGAMLGGGFLGQLGTYLSEPTDLLSRLGTALPTTANFFIQFVIARALMTNCMRLLWPHTGTMLMSIFRSLLRLGVPRSLHQAAWVHMIPTSRAAGWYNGIVQVFMFGFAFAVVSPLILPCCWFFFLTGFFAYRYCILYVFERGYESGGRMWPVLFDQMMGFLVLLELFSGAVLFVNGSFWLAGVMWATLTPPLALFWNYNRRRFLLPLHHPPLSLVAREPVGAAVDPLVYTPPALRPGAIGWYPEQGKVWEKHGVPRHCC
ncbi:hypothetical protein HYH03_012111 [Edaphochlamys debaryana]|uniref:ERD4-related membrane n=1 Tax=Edaphochlamys debaryana TaxID=47281 RepID=A0A836BUJ4_9CHLO|nr:hypothetical protein HYH03_012111 [Edaphochlamys debaryana]|eukprot:KAG2489475.1 hypothetical protein HYH03_012111 [Edaphochlamys debaryana]